MAFNKIHLWFIAVTSGVVLVVFLLVGVGPGFSGPILVVAEGPSSSESVSQPVRLAIEGHDSQMVAGGFDSTVVLDAERRDVWDLNLSHRLSLILCETEPDLVVEKRIALLNGQSSLSSGEIDALYQFLESQSNQTGLNQDDFYWLKNDVMTFLRSTEANDDVYADRLSALFSDQNQDIVIRDYALQHLSVWAEGNSTESSIARLVEQGVLEKDATIAGTALLAWDRLDEIDGGQSKLELGEHAVRIAHDDTYSLESRVSALQVASKYRPSEALRAARDVLGAETSAILLQVSAIGVLSQSHTDDSSNQLLQDLRNHPDKRLRRAAIAALNTSI